MTPNSAPQRLSAWLEQAWLARYLDRQLDGAETEWFEAYALDKPELLTMIDADTRLRDALAADASAGRRDAPPASAARGMDDARDGGSKQPAGTGSAETATESGALDFAIATTSNVVEFQNRREPRASANSAQRTSWLGLAAALVLGLGVGGIAMRVATPPRGADLVANPTSIIYDTMRGGAAKDSRVEHGDGTSPLVLIEVAVPPGAQNITLHIDDEADQALTPSRDGFVSFLLPRELVQQHKLATVSYALTGGSGKRSIDLEIP